MSNSKRVALAACLVAASSIVACSKPTATSDSGAPSASAMASAAPSASVSAAPSASAAASASVDAGASGILVLRWSATKTKADSPKLAVSLRAGAATLPVGELDATSDDAGKSGTPAACSLKKTSSTASTFTCGGVPAYNFLTAELKDGQLVISRTKGVDGEKNSEKTTEVKRLPVTQAALRTLAYKPPAAAAAKTVAAKPTCPKGQIASDYTGTWRCTELCTGDADCKAPGTFCDVRRDITPDGRIGAVLESGCEKNDP